MSRLSISAFKDAGEPLEIHWLAGLKQAEDGSWLVRVVTCGLQSQRVKMWLLPIGILPLLSLGLRFEGGVLLDTQSRGELRTVYLSNLNDGVELTSSDIPSGLYSFFGGSRGVQRLVRYETDDGEVLVPTIELIRYLLVHNKTLANALMVPGQLLTLYHFEPIGVHKDLTLQFTADMPLRALSGDFALEFAWLAIHPEGRRTWDSVYRKSAGREYVSLDLPDVPSAKMMFRGISLGSICLALEVIHLSGRDPPCETLRYGHPGLTMPGGSVVIVQSRDEHGAGKAKGGADAEVLSSENGTRMSASQPVVDVGRKFSEFTVEVPIEKIWSVSDRPQRRYQKTSTNIEDGDVSTDMVRQRTLIKGAVGREKRGAQVSPLEFRTLEAYSWDFAGELQVLADTITIMAGLVSDTEISMSLCRLKSGRAFSTIGRRPRCCLVIHILVADKPPIVLIDVDRGGEHALSTMSLVFLENSPFSVIETYVKNTLDCLVERGGHWDPNLEAKLRNICKFTRLPKVMSKRGSDANSQYRNAWAWRLAKKLALPLHTYIHNVGY